MTAGLLVPPAFPDLRDVPLADLPALSAALSHVLERVMPGVPLSTVVPVAAFQSGI
jgi:FXSXX-COOH protein